MSVRKYGRNPKEVTPGGAQALPGSVQTRAIVNLLNFPGYTRTSNFLRVLSLTLRTASLPLVALIRPTSSAVPVQLTFRTLRALTSARRLPSHWSKNSFQNLYPLPDWLIPFYQSSQLPPFFYSLPEVTKVDACLDFKMGGEAYLT